MLGGNSFILCGLSRLTVRVAQTLVNNHAQVTVVRKQGEGSDLLRLLSPEVRVREAATQESADAMPKSEVSAATCLLAIADDDLDNLRVAVAAREIAPNVPVVLRAFDPSLADQLEQGLNVRRAFSVSALAAPAFVAAAFGDDVLETLRIGEGEVPICQLIVREGSPLLGLNAPLLKARYGCAVIARTPPGGACQPVKGDAGDAPLIIGEEIVIGGLLPDVLRMTGLNAGLLSERKRRRWFWKKRTRRVGPRRFAPPTLLPLVASLLTTLLIVSVFVFGWALHLRPVDAIYFVITTATTTGYGDISLKDAPDWVKLFGNLVMLSGGALLGIVFSYLAAITTAERLDEAMHHQAERLSGHVVVAGLGNLGYRVTRNLNELGLDVSVVELAPDARFVEAVRVHAPVLTGDARLPENLERAGVGRAAAFIACTNDDLANIQACLHARRLNPKIRTVARIFDDALAARLTQVFEIDQALSASQSAVSAFVGAATDERALRPFLIAGQEFLACRYTVTVTILAETVTHWRAQGLRLLAYHPCHGKLQPPSALTGDLAPAEEVIVCGPASTLRRILYASDKP